MSSKRMRQMLGTFLLSLLLTAVALPAAAAESGPEIEIGVWTWLANAYDSLVGWFSPTSELNEGLAARDLLGGTPIEGLQMQPAPAAAGGDTASSVDPDG